ncbi:MAG: hypothetical protein DRJ66_05060 [Thermoprotei archaeon]|nr:MAG: hypothetical protein DRJ66_05060 [Thermoprotei archaeon]
MNIDKRVIQGSTVLLVLIAIIVGAYVAEFSAKQILSLTVFSLMIIGVLFLWEYKVVIAFSGLALMFIFGLINVHYLIHSANLEIIIFLICMMIIVGFLEERGFFEYMMRFIVYKIGDNAELLISILMLLSGVLSSIVGNITTMLFITTNVLYLTAKYNLSPMPLILMTAFASNVGSAAMLMGNPVSVIVAFRGGLTLSDFIRIAMPIALTALALLVIVNLRMFKGYLYQVRRALRSEGRKSEEESVVKDLDVCIAVFVGLLVGLLLYHKLEEVFNLEKNTLLLGVALLFASICLILDRRSVRDVIEHRVDWYTLSFFIIFFGAVGSLEYTGVSEKIAELLAGVSHERITLIIILTLFTGVLSAFLDNVLAVATMAPVIESLKTLGLEVEPLWWATLFGATFFGNLTIIASASNIVAIGIMERRGYHMELSEWIKYGIPITLVTTLVALGMLCLIYH